MLVGYVVLFKLEDGIIFNSWKVFLKVVFSDKLIIVEKKVLVKFFGDYDDNVEICYFELGKNKGEMEFNLDFCDYENVLFKENIYDYFECEVIFYVLLVWIDEIKCDE